MKKDDLSEISVFFLLCGINYTEVDCSLAETTESARMLRYFAQICLQIFTSFPQIYDVQRS